MNRTIIDISPPLTSDLAVFPGDTALRREILVQRAGGKGVTVSTMHATVHLGAHADAPSHYSDNGDSIDTQSLALYVGPCQVLRVANRAGTRVSVADLEGAEISEERVLLQTGSFPDPEKWSSDFRGLEPALVDYLADRGVTLVGVDTPSVDTAESKDLPTHARCFARDVSILEGVVLQHVEPGKYELIALPLNLVGFDGSPVRAILRTLT